MTQIIAIDWSGRDTGAAEFICLAKVVDDRLVELENGYERAEVVRTAIDSARADRARLSALTSRSAFPRGTRCSGAGRLVGDGDR